jgi:hypothetical protein
MVPLELAATDQSVRDNYLIQSAYQTPAIVGLSSGVFMRRPNRKSFSASQQPDRTLRQSS